MLLWGGAVFFGACMAHQYLAAAAPPAAADALLRGAVLGGTLLYVFSKGAKFSLFK